MKHTPGPWQAIFLDHWRVFTRTEELFDAEMQVANHLTKADARLIAAAPEMYEALKRMSRVLCGGEEYEQARAALAKADGEEG